MGQMEHVAQGDGGADEAGGRAEALPDMAEKDTARPPEADGGGNKQSAAAGGPTEAAPTGSDTSGGVDRVCHEVWL